MLAHKITTSAREKGSLGELKLQQHDRGASATSTTICSLLGHNCGACMINERAGAKHQRAASLMLELCRRCLRAALLRSAQMQAGPAKIPTFSHSPYRSSASPAPRVELEAGAPAARQVERACQASRVASQRGRATSREAGQLVGRGASRRLSA